MKLFLALIVLTVSSFGQAKINGTTFRITGLPPNSLDISCISSTGTDAFACNVSSQLVYEDGAVVLFRPTASSCSGPATIDMSSKGSKKLFAADGTSDPACEQDRNYLLTYDSTLDSAAGAWTMPAAGTGGGATSISGLNDLKTTVSGSVGTVAAGNVNIISAGVPTTTTVSGGTITEASASDTGTFYIYVTSSGTLACLRGAGITIGNYTVSSGFAGSTCPSGSAFPADSIPLATIDMSSGTMQTPVDLRAIFSRDPISAGTCITKTGNTIALDTTCGVLVSPFTKNAQTSTYQVLTTDFDTCKTITVASGTFTITLVASGSQPIDGKCISIINYGSGVVTVARSGQNINGGTTSLTIPAASATAPTGAKIYSDGTNYFAALFGASSGGTPFEITDLLKFTTRWSMWQPGREDDASSAGQYTYGANCTNAGGFGSNGQSLSSIIPWLFKTTGGSDDQICIAYSPNTNNFNYGIGMYDFVSGATPLEWGVKGVVKIKDRNADYYYGRSTSTANFNNFVGLRALTTDTNWFCVIINGGSATTSDTGVAVVLSTGDTDGDTKLEVSNGAAVANDITCKVNGTSDTVAATIPTSFRSFDIWGGQQQGVTASVWGVAQLAWWVNGIGSVE